MVGTKSPQELLETAASLVEDALRLVNAGPRTCPCCERTVYSNWHAHLLLESLQPMPGKLRRFAREQRAFPPRTRPVRVA